MEEYRQRMQARHQGRGGAQAPPAVVAPQAAQSVQPTYSSIFLGDPRREAQRPLLSPSRDGWLPDVNDSCLGLDVQTTVLTVAGALTLLILFVGVLQLMS